MSEILQTPFGIFAGVTSVSRDEDGRISGIMLNEKNAILTHAGELIPFYTSETARRKYKNSVTFHQNGMIKSVSLDKQQEVITPIGEFPAELVTFYDTGELKRVFILDGKMSGFWSEEDEKQLNIPFTFEFDFTKFTAMLVGIYFYKSGEINSITLFPGETIDVTTKYRTITAKNGFSLYENGSLQSVEPQMPTPVPTPIGTISAYDVNSIGVNADNNSLQFDKKGDIKHLCTSNHIIVQKEDGQTIFLSPVEKQSLINENEVAIIPLSIEFEGNIVSITEEKTYQFDITNCKFNIIDQSATSCSPEMCASCSLCKV